VSSALALPVQNSSAAPVPELAWAPLASLTLPTSPAVDVYASKLGTQPKLLWKHNNRLGDDHLTEMRRYAGQFAFWVSKADYRRVTDAVETNWSEIAMNRRLTPCDRIALFEMACALELNARFSLMKCSPYVQTATTVAHELTSILLEGGTTSLDLFYAIQNPRTASARHFQIASFVFQLARLGGEKDPATLERMVLGALVHDVGARDILVDVWGSSRRWTEEEREAVERHPQRSYEALIECGLETEQLMMAYQHHERADGSGYPVKILHDEIHPWARMLAVADRFQALVAGRRYRQPLSLEDAVNTLTIESEKHLDPEITTWWIKSLQSN
jgi:response regulator RpfG family c-di-GMP phosphodiesterase